MIDPQLGQNHPNRGNKISRENFMRDIIYRG